MFQAVKIQSEDALSMKAQMSIMKYLADRYAVIAVRSCMKYAPIDLKLLIPWMYGFTTVSYTFFDNSGELRAPSALRIAEATEKLAVLDKNCVVISSFTDNENIKHGNLFVCTLMLIQFRLQLISPRRQYSYFASLHLTRLRFLLTARLVHCQMKVRAEL